MIEKLRHHLINSSYHYFGADEAEGALSTVEVKSWKEPVPKGKAKPKPKYQAKTVHKKQRTSSPPPSTAVQKVPKAPARPPPGRELTVAVNVLGSLASPTEEGDNFVVDRATMEEVLHCCKSTYTAIKAAKRVIDTATASFGDSLETMAESISKLESALRRR